MASSFPTSLDAFTNPSSADALDSVSVPHASQHSDLNDAVEALEAKVGVNSSAVVSSHDYKIAQLEAGVTGGKILQVVTTHKNDVFTTTSTSYVDVTGLSVTITPSSATSKILVLSNISTTGQSGVSAVFVQLVRNSTALSVGSSSPSASDVGANVGTTNSVAMAYLDSPATTSATTYKWQVRGVAGTVAINQIQGGGLYTASNIVVLEVAA